MGAKLNSSALQGFAPHIVYECRAAVAELDELRAHIARSGRGDAVYNALIEAILVHVRLLDDFLRTEKARAKADDVTAQHYASSWAPTAVLASNERKHVNGQLHHLAARRQNLEKWDLDDLVERTAIAFLGFLDVVRSDQPLRHPWFAECRTAFDRYV